MWSETIRMHIYKKTKLKVRTYLCMQLQVLGFKTVAFCAK